MNVRVGLERKLRAEEFMLFNCVLEKTLERPLDRREIKPVHPKGNRPERSLEGLMLKLKLQNFGHLMQRTDSFEMTLILERKAMKNLDSILKSKVITLPTKVHVVKAMVFPVVMYGCESWTIKTAEHQRVLLNCGVGEDS